MGSKKRTASLVLAFILLFYSAGCSNPYHVYAKPFSVSPSPYSTIETSSSQSSLISSETCISSAKVTLLFYIIGSDLESQGGYASQDIEEILAASVGDDVNLLLCTGGALSWRNRSISSDGMQIHLVENGELTLVSDTDEGANMSSPDTLASFISFAKENYPAERYSIVLWDHGGGTFSGFGSDENYPYDCMTISEMYSAFREGGIHFDFVGFDACLMATIETAYMLMPYADYLIASVETEPSSGWYYTDWLTTLSQKPDMDTLKLGTQIVDDYIAKCGDNGGEFCVSATLSVVDLSRVSDVYKSLCCYMSTADSALEDLDYRAISVARADAKYYGGGEYEQVDIVDLVSRSTVSDSDELIATISKAVRYVGTTGWIDNCCGLAMYFPYDYIEYYSDMQYELHDIGMGREYTDFFDHFVNIMAGGRLYSGGMSSPFDYESPDVLENGYSEYDWYDSGVAGDYGSYYNSVSYEERDLIDKGDYYALRLSDAEWDTITNAELQVMLDDGDGYIDLGSDNVCVFDDDGDLIVDFDYTWVTLEGVTAPFYNEYEYEDGNVWVTYGYVPAMLNNEEYVEIIICWDDTHPTGFVAGYRMAYTDLSPMGKGLFLFSSGDAIDILCNYYTYDGDYDDVYLFGDTIIVGASELDVCYDYVGYDICLVSIMLTDIYRNTFWTETVEIAMNY